MIDLPPAVLHGEVQPQCVQMVASSYQHDPLVLIGLLKAEAGRVGMKNQNKNKSFDYGVAQINSIWLKDLVGVGFTEQVLMYDACRNLWAAGWILQRCMNRHKGDLWTAVGCYHAGENARTPAQLERLAEYSQRVQRYLNKSGGLARQWLAGGYTVNSVQYPYTKTQRAVPAKAKGVSMHVKDAP